MNFAANQELIVRLAVFIGVLLLMLLWEKLAPLRFQARPLWLRRANNLLLVAVNTLLLRLLIPVAAVSMANIAHLHGWGLFNQFPMPAWSALIVSFLALDLVIYFQHRLFHYYPLLWRLHRVHHSDTEFDVTTGLRFHPLEILLSMLVKITAVAALGAPVLAVIVFEVVLNATSLFNHGNVSLGARLDAILRCIVVTPDMHRVHHSALQSETNSNFGFNIPWWDRLFGTYIAQPELGHDKLKIGLNEFRDKRFVHLLWLLKQPWLDSASYTENRGES